MSGPAYHGWTHGKNGTDPLPVDPEAGDFIFAPNQPADLFALETIRETTTGPGAVGTTGGRWYQVWLDPTVAGGIPGGAYLNNWHKNAYGIAATAIGPSTPSSNVGDTIYFRFALGPTGSSWWINLGFMCGPDFGVLNYALASVPDVVANPGSLATWDNLNWITNSGAWFDAYENLGGRTYPRADYQTPWAVKVTGAPGVAATTLSSSGVTDGGPGIYALKLFVRSKNVSSTSYKAGLWYLSLNRFPLLGGGLPYQLDPS